jgi:hypothetical protein
MARRKYPLPGSSDHNFMAKIEESLKKEIFKKIEECVFIALNHSPFSSRVSNRMFNESFAYHKKRNTLTECKWELSQILGRLKRKGTEGDPDFCCFAKEIENTLKKEDEKVEELSKRNKKHAYQRLSGDAQKEIEKMGKMYVSPNLKTKEEFRGNGKTTCIMCSLTPVPGTDRCYNHSEHESD